MYKLLVDMSSMYIPVVVVVVEICPLEATIDDKLLSRAGGSCSEATAADVATLLVGGSRFPSSPTSCEMPAYSISCVMVAVERLVRWEGGEEEEGGSRRGAWSA